MSDVPESINCESFADEEEDEIERLLSSFAAGLASYVAMLECDDDVGRTPGSKNVKRERVPVETIFSRLGPRFIRKVYRMTELSFWKLLSLLKPYLPNEKKRKRGVTPNGDVSNAARLSMALRWFAGGEPADIFQTHGVHYLEVYHSVWLVVDAVNQCPELQLGYPRDHNVQLEIASAFKSKSQVGFSNCAGCKDGMLVWTNKPSKPSLEDAGFGPLK